ncbi:hypothetical protein D3C73_1265950 [compost metagenome]
MSSVISITFVKKNELKKVIFITPAPTINNVTIAPLKTEILNNDNGSMGLLPFHWETRNKTRSKQPPPSNDRIVEDIQPKSFTSINAYVRHNIAPEINSIPK